MECEKDNYNEDVFTLLLVTRVWLNATTMNATAMTRTMTTTMTTSNANAADGNKDDVCKYRNGHEPIPCDGLPTRTQYGQVGNSMTSSLMRSWVRFPFLVVLNNAVIKVARC